MARIILVTGGCRSGKSAHAQKLAESLPGAARRAYIATAPVIDEEMRTRVRKHQQARAAAAGGWTTIEAPIELAEAIAAAGMPATEQPSQAWHPAFDVLLVDCLTLWVNNLMYRAEQAGGQITEDAAAEECEHVLAACRAHPGTVIFVTNEVGMGIVPDNAMARRFRDLVGRCNQLVAAAADSVQLVCSGIPLTLKGG